jgi:hypothetical protein
MSFDFAVLGAQAQEQQPHPGSVRDMVGQSEQQASSALPPGESAAGEFTVPVKPDVAEECVPRTQILSAANPFLQILPRDMRRSRAVVIPVTNPVYLCESPDLASQIAAYVIAGGTAVQPMGAYLPTSVGVPLDHRDAMWAVVSTTASTSPVTVIVQRFAG